MELTILPLQKCGILRSVSEFWKRRKKMLASDVSLTLIHKKSSLNKAEVSIAVLIERDPCAMHYTRCVAASTPARPSTKRSSPTVAP